MSTKELMESMKRMSLAERLALIEAAARCIRDDLDNAKKPKKKRDTSHLLRVAGCVTGEPFKPGELDEILYGEAQK